jgi:hypothetical protein
MATETLISPGVLTTENDQSFVTAGQLTVGLALVGPTVKGPVNIPTVVTSYSDFSNKFGGAFVSGGASYEYLTSIAAYKYFQQGGDSILVHRVTSGSYTEATATVGVTGSNSLALAQASSSFTLKTISNGIIASNSGSMIAGGYLDSGSSENVRWEIQNVNMSNGTFTLLVRQGSDNTNVPNVLETFANVSLDPLSSNYIEAVVGNQYKTVEYDSSVGGFYIKTNGDYVNQSRYVYVSSVNKPTPNYFLNNGTANPIYTSSAVATAYLPGNGSGSIGGAFSGSQGNDWASVTNMFTNIGSTTQGLVAANYVTASSILSNTDEYKFNLITTPGLISDDNTAASDFITLAEERGDCFYIVDLTSYTDTIGTATSEAQSLDSSYAGAYYPWVQVVSQETGKLVFVPPSTVMAGVYAFNDKVAAEWFAPAGLNRGGLGGVIQAARKLSPTDRDTLYASKVNPIATFPGVGVVAYGQKTLQQKASALDRINVRRLLINLKNYVGAVGQTLVFEQNTATTRNNFLAQVNPYLESVQQKQGLYAFKVVMDDSNNTPDVIDRNQLIGQIYIQPTKTVEFVLLSFNITPTGASFS